MHYRRAFLLGTFDGACFWRDAPFEMHYVAREWFEAKEGGFGGRNTLLRERLGRTMSELKDLADRLFRFELVRATELLS